MRRIGSAATGAGVALLPLIAGAQASGGERAIDPPGDLSETLLYTLLALGGLFLLTTIGYTYRVKRSLNWRFQQPDDVHHDEHH